MRVLLDTNVLVSGFLYPSSIPGKILAAWQRGEFHLVISDTILDEAKRVLQYKKISKRLREARITPQEIDDFLVLLKFFSIGVIVEQTEVSAIRDRADEHVLAAYQAGRADCLVTGDKDFNQVVGYHIMTPQIFWETHLHF